MALRATDIDGPESHSKSAAEAAVYREEVPTF